MENNNNVQSVLTLQGYPHLQYFLKKHEAHNFQVIKSEVGFGNACVGIVKDLHYVEYAKFNDDFTLAVESNAAVFNMPKDGYQKNPCFCVVYENDLAVEEYPTEPTEEEKAKIIQKRVEMALDQLEDWIMALNRYGYILENYDKKTVWGRTNVFYVRNPDNTNIAETNF